MHRELYRDKVMEIKKKGEEEVVLPSETEEQKKAGDENEAKGLNRDGTPKQDPLKAELERIQQKGGRSKREKLLYTKTRLEEQLKELDDEEGIEDLDNEDDKPVTVGMLKKIQQQTATKTALQLADEIQNESERELTKYHIENTIRSSGDPKKDLELAQVHVFAAKNTQIIEEIKRKPETKKHASAGGHNPKDGKVEDELTPEETALMNFGRLKKEDVLKARKK